MSPRAAWRLEQYGFEEVYEYTGGKEDWLAAGREVEGDQQGRPLLAELARTDVAECQLDDRAGDVLDRIGDLGFALVLGDERVVLGKLLRRHAESDPDAAVKDVLVEGPTTVRASEDPVGLLERMRRAETGSVIVTTKEGRLIGVAVTADLADAVDGHGHDHDHV
ncbi:MAG: CBS domain-containing protein [Actinobacteria bacterium]|nr:CBS domain-containing protein [Actinomycetota bacterium]